MDRRRDTLGEVGVEPFATLLGDAELTPEECLRGCRPETDEHARPHDRELGFEPRAAGGELAPAGLRMDAALAARLPFEVLDPFVT